MSIWHILLLEESGIMYHGKEIIKSQGVLLLTSVCTSLICCLGFLVTSKKSVVHRLEGDIAAGYLELKRARVRWILSINYDFLPEPAKEKGMRTYRSITVGDEEIEFSGGFTELHTRSYQHIMDGHGFGIGEVKNCIKTVYDIRNSTPIGLSGDYHPLAGQV